MIDTTRALRIIGSREDHNGPARFIALDGEDIIVRSAGGKLGGFNRITGRSVSAQTPKNAALRLENEPIRTTTRMYARRSANGQSIRLQPNRPLTSIGEIEIDVENNKIVGARVVS